MPASLTEVDVLGSFRQHNVVFKTLHPPSLPEWIGNKTLLNFLFATKRVFPKREEKKTESNSGGKTRSIPRNTRGPSRLNLQTSSLLLEAIYHWPGSTRTADPNHVTSVGVVAKSISHHRSEIQRSDIRFPNVNTNKRYGFISS